MVQPFPAPSLRELLSAAKLRECSSMNVSGQKFQSLYALVGNRWHGGTIGGHSLSQPLRAASSLREGAGDGVRTIQCAAREPEGGGRFSSPLRNSEDFGLVPFNVPLGNREGAGDFHRPYEGSGNFTFCQSSGDTPSVTPFGRASSLREGAGNGCGGAYHSMCRSETVGGRAIFIAPTKALIFLHFTVHRNTC